MAIEDTERGGTDYRPYVILDFIYDKGLFYITIRNIGKRSAFKVSVHFDKDFNGVEGRKEISKLPIFTNIEFMPPDKEISLFLDSSFSYFSRGEPTKIDTKITFQNYEGRKYEFRMMHDLGVYKELGYIKRVQETGKK
jgi:hypothetical protein